MRSLVVESDRSNRIPNSLTLPSGFRISTRRTGLGLSVSRSSASLSSNHLSLRFGRSSFTVIPSIPGFSPFLSTRSNAAYKFCLSHNCSHSSAFTFPSSLAFYFSSLYAAISSFTSLLFPTVPLSFFFCLPCSSLYLLLVLRLLDLRPFPLRLWWYYGLIYSFISLSSASSTCSLNQGYRLHPDDRSPQVRTLSFPAHLPYLLLCPLVASLFVLFFQLARPQPHTFLFLNLILPPSSSRPPTPLPSYPCHYSSSFTL